MRNGVFIVLCAALLGGCAASPSATATCTDLISTGGGILKYCQTGRRIDVSESGVDPSADPPLVKVVDDPAVLNALQRDAALHPSFQSSRKLVAKACTVGDTDYLSVSVRDLKRMLSERQAPPAATPGADPAAAAPRTGEPG